MDFKYYHGTSTIFLDSIRNNGLGTINPNIDFKNLEVLAFLKNKCEKYIVDNENYKKIRASTIAMVNQSHLQFVDKNGNSQIVNFRHNGIYVSMSRIKAATYAASNKSGSEILERCITLYKLLKKKNIEFSIPEKINLFNIEQYIDHDAKPIIVEVQFVPDDMLELEKGGSAKEQLNFIRKSIPTMKERFKYIFLQECNFRLLEPISPERLKFYKLDYEGEISTNTFEITLERI